MIHPNRTYLLQQKEKRCSVENSLNILKARRQALIAEFLATARPFLRSRREIAAEYRRAIEELQLSLARESRTGVAAIAAVSEQEVGVRIEPRNILGVKYKEALITGSFSRPADQRPYDIGLTTPHLEEAIARFENVVENMLRVAAFESKLKKLSRDIRQLARKSRVLEQRVLPALGRNLKMASQYISEREREDYYRLKKFKDMQAR